MTFHFCTANNYVLGTLKYHTSVDDSAVFKLCSIDFPILHCNVLVIIYVPVSFDHVSAIDSVSIKLFK